MDFFVAQLFRRPAEKFGLFVSIHPLPDTNGSGIRCIYGGGRGGVSQQDLAEFHADRVGRQGPGVLQNDQVVRVVEHL